MDSDKQKKISTILDNFNRQVSRIMKIAEAKEKDNIDVIWVRKLISLIRQENPPLILERCIDKLWDNREQIMKRDMDFFLKNSFGKYVKDDDNKEWLTGLISMVQKKQALLSEDEKKYIWDCINKMLECVIQYRIIMGDFSS
jgi:hypothetical protein